MGFRFTFDPIADAVHMRITETAILESEEVQPGLILDFDADGKIVGMEFLNARERFSTEAIKQFSEAA